MVSMNIIILLILIILLIVAAINFSSISNRIDRIEFDLMEIRRLLSKTAPEKKAETVKQPEEPVKTSFLGLKIEPVDEA